MRAGSRIRVSATAVLLALFVAACGSGASGDPSTGTPAADAAEVVLPPGAEVPGSGEGADLTAEPGPVALALRRAMIAGKQTSIVTSNGRTVYRFEGDEHDPPRVRCLDDCVVTWPPVVLSSAAPTLDGIPESEVGTAVRQDGQRQVTLGGWPLYYFADDRLPGDVLGEGLAGNWSVVAADGKPIVKKSGRPELEPTP
ncbi:hypothetical protein WEH80_26570 [Actinomycetes bacterium KLBMP 9759]